MKKTKRKYDIFISYRRGSGLYFAKNIAHALEKKGYHVFFDYNSIENGDFNTQIYMAIEESRDFILILSENALNDCINENDWVKNEILHAHKNKKNIILAQDDKKFIQWPILPDNLDFLRMIDWTPINPKLFEGSIKLLCSRLKAPKPTIFKKIILLLIKYWYILLITITLLSSILTYIYYPLVLAYRKTDYWDSYKAMLPSHFTNDVTEILDDIFGHESLDVIFAFGSDDSSVFAVTDEDFEGGLEVLLYDFEKLLDTDMTTEILKELDLRKYADYTITALTSAGSRNFKVTFKMMFMQEVPFIEFEDDNHISVRAIMYNIDEEVFRNFTLSIYKDNYNLIEQKRQIRAFDKMIKSFEEID